MTHTSHMKYDDAETYLLNCETEIPDAEEACGTHIGIYLAWIVNNAMASDSLSVNAEPVRQRISSGRTLLFERCDGKLMSYDLNERGNAFTQAYYEFRYFKDYEETLGLDAEDPEALLRVENTWSNYDKVAQRLDARLREWQVVSALPSRAELLRILETEFVPWLDQMGFIRNPHSFSDDRGHYIKTESWGMHSITLCAIDDRPNFYGMGIEVSSRLTTLAQAVHDDLAIDNPRQSSELPTTFYEPTLKWLGNWPVPLHAFRGGPMLAIPITDRAQIQPVIAMVRKRAASVLPGLLRTLETLEGYDRLYCTEPLSASPYFRGHRTYISCARILCAELAENPRLLAICDEIEQALDTLPELKKPGLGLEVKEMRGRLQRVRERSLSK
ncbi:MAG: hypothetical protein KKH74_12465 [Gammaproteobacteria bacterium]|nr:hypothetical protein [Gammaproteobacteria bacterium]MBU1731807.1 hypothetical protein [Gammaproteobacteria bacterium]MBU1892418.1 hypothetical protein [Gammaproteobacteria bacterium]